MAVADAWAAAIVSDDASRIARFMTDDWAIVSERGPGTRGRFLSLVESGELTHSAMDRVGEPRVRVHGDLAVLTARVASTAHHLGVRHDGDEWTTDVFTRRGGSWRCVLTHITSAAPAGPGAAPRAGSATAARGRRRARLAAAGRMRDTRRVESLVEGMTRGNVIEVKTVLASVALALGVYQLALIAVGYGRVRPPFLAPGPASTAHRASGDVIAALVVVVAAMCVGAAGVEGDAAVHIAAGVGLLAVLSLKVAVVRRWHGLSHLLPVIGSAIFLLLALAWATSAGGVLADR